MTIDKIMLAKFRKNPNGFRELDESEMVWPGDILIDDGIPKYCGGPFHGGPTVKNMRNRLIIKRNLRYFRAYPDA
jgi:hypothetical protein